MSSLTRLVVALLATLRDRFLTGSLTGSFWGQSNDWFPAPSPYGSRNRSDRFPDRVLTAGTTPTTTTTGAPVSNPTWNPENGPKISAAWHAIRDTLAAANGPINHDTLIAVACHTGIVEKAADNLLRELSNHGYLRRDRGCYRLADPITSAGQGDPITTGDVPLSAPARVGLDPADVASDDVMLSALVVSGAGLDLDAIEAEFLSECGVCDAGLPLPCSCTHLDYRPTMLALVAEVRRLTREVAYEDETRRHCISWMASGNTSEDLVASLIEQAKSADERREAAEAEVVTLRAEAERNRRSADATYAELVRAQGQVVDLRAKVAAVEALLTEWRAGGAASNPFPDGVVLDVEVEILAPLCAALATTGEGQ
jgi:hypothetical protein